MEKEFSLDLAVLIGINAYENGIPPLKTPVRDVTSLKQLLHSKYGYTAWTRLDREATAKNLRELLQEELPSKLDEESRFLFYFAGHGIASDSESLEGPRGFLLPQDAKRDLDSYLPMVEIYKALTELPCRHSLAILDCCFAGAFRWASTREVRRPPAKLYEERYRHFVRHPAWQVITSAAHNERAIDVPAGRAIGERGLRGQHSPFAFYLLKGLEGAADQYPPGGDGVITASELFAYLQNSFAASQTPRTWCLPRHGQGEFVFREPHRALTLPRAEDQIKLDITANPYRGLSAYQKGNAELFFGREKEITRLAEHVVYHSLTVVVGASGTGKSSLVQAGLLPFLDSMDGDPWKALLPIRPGDRPLEALYHALLSDEVLGASTACVDKLRTDANSLEHALKRWLKAQTARHVVLVVDQLEELFTMERKREDRETFLHSLGEVLAMNHPRLHLVLTLRADFEPPLVEGPLAPYWSDARFPIRTLNRKELCDVVERPAEERELLFEGNELIELLVDEVASVPSALPLLSFTLHEMYRQYIRSGRGDRMLSFEDFRMVGGVTGSLRLRAEEEYQKCDERTRMTFRRVMLRMVGYPGDELTRRRVSRDELNYPSDTENKQVEEVIRRLSEARLIVQGLGADEEPFVEPAHDALINTWKRLDAWIGEDSETLLLQRRVAQASDDWVRAGRQRAFLWHGDPRLDLLRSVAHSSANWLNRQETEFVGASWNVRVVKRIGALFVATLLIFGFSYLPGQIETRKRAQRIAEAQRLATHSQVVREEKPQLSLLLAVEANRLLREKDPPVPAAEQALRDGLSQIGGQGLTGHEKKVVAAAISADQRWLATGSEDGTARLWDLSSNTGISSSILLDAHRLAGGTWVKALAFSPDSRWLVTAAGAYGGLLQSNDHSFILWDLKHNQRNPPYRVFETHDGEVSAVAFSPSGRRLATGSSDRSVRIWDFSEGQLSEAAILKAHDDDISTLVFHRDETKLATASRRGDIAIWSLTPEISTVPLEILSGNIDQLSDVAVSLDLCWAANFEDAQTMRVYSLCREDSTRYFRLRIPGGHSNRELEMSPNSRWLLTLPGELSELNRSSDKPATSAFLWRMSNEGPQLAQRLSAEKGLFVEGLFSPDSRRLITAGTDRQVRFWDLSHGGTWTGPTILHGHEGAVRTLAVGDRWLATGGDDHTARIWSLEPEEFRSSPVVLSGHGGDVRTLMFSADGRWLATGCDDGYVRLWSFEDGVSVEPYTLLQGHDSRITKVIVDSSSRSIISGSIDGTIRVWESRKLLSTLTGCTHDISSLAVSPGGDWLIAGDFQGHICLWSRESGKLTPLPSHRRMVSDLSFSLDGRWFASGSWDGTARLWPILIDNENMANFVELNSHTAAISSLAFSHDGRWLITGGWDDTARLWPLWIENVGDESFILEGHKDNVNGVGFSKHDDWAITISEDTTVRLWKLSQNDDPPARVVELLGHQNGINDFVLSSDGKRLVTGGRDSKVLIWRLDADDPSAVPPIVLDEHQEEVWSLAVSNEWIASASLDDTVILWPSKLEDLIEHAVRTAGRNLSPYERQEFLHIRSGGD